MSSEAKVGLLVIVALAVFVTTFLVVANMQLTGQTIQYKTYFSYIGGLDEGNLVRFGGRKAGTVRILRPWSDDMTKTEVIFTLRAEVPVNQESVATIASLNALGQNYLEIMPGSIEASRIEAGGTVQSVESLTFSDLTRKVSEVADTAVAVMSRMDAKFATVADDIHGLMVNLQQISGEENQRNIAKLLDSSTALIETQSPKIDQITTQLSETLVRVDSMTEEVRRLATSAGEVVNSVHQTVDDTREPLATSLDELEATLKDTRQVLADARALILVNESGIEEIIDNLRAASQDIEALSAELRQRPWTLIRRAPKADRQVPPVAGSKSPSQ